MRGKARQRCKREFCRRRPSGARGRFPALPYPPGGRLNLLMSWVVLVLCATVLVLVLVLERIAETRTHCHPQTTRCLSALDRSRGVLVSDREIARRIESSTSTSTALLSTSTTLATNFKPGIPRKTYPLSYSYSVQRYSYSYSYSKTIAETRTHCHPQATRCLSALDQLRGILLADREITWRIESSTSTAMLSTSTTLATNFKPGILRNA